MPPEMLKTLHGYDPDVAKNRAEAKQIMERLGYGPSKRLATKVSVRNIAPARDPAVILIDQLKEIYIDGELETVDTTTWYPKDRPKGLPRGPPADGEWPRRSGPGFLRKLYLHGRTQLRRLLQPGSRQAGRPPVDGNQCRDAPPVGVADRAATGQ